MSDRNHDAPIVSDDWESALLHGGESPPVDTEEYFVVAETGRPWGGYSRRELLTALVDPGDVDSLLANPDGIGVDVQTPGPGPSSQDGVYEPWFRIWSEVGPLESLVLSWSSGGRTVFQIDPGFLMTFGLTPRLSSRQGRDLIVWDDPTLPESSIAEIVPSAYDHYDDSEPAWAVVKKTHVRRYAVLRGKSVIQVFLERNMSDSDEEIESLLAETRSLRMHLPGRIVNLRRDFGLGPGVYVEQIGIRALVHPPPDERSRDWGIVGDLEWPSVGLVEDVPDARSRVSRIAVSDSLLGEYEGREEYDVNPELGSVSFGGQWTIPAVGRFGRDSIAIDLKHLYEGCPSDVISAVHSYAVEIPDDWHLQTRTPNIATRTRNVTYGIVDLGEGLQSLAERLNGHAMTTEEFVGLSRQELDYCGWWTNDQAAPAAYHAPLEMTKSEFLTRCADLDKLVVEGLGERALRETLVLLGFDGDELEGYRSIILLGTLAAVAQVSIRTGIGLHQSGALLKRFREDPPNAPIGALLSLRDIRDCTSHRTGSSSSRSLDDAIGDLVAEPPGETDGWGVALDAVYDSVSSSLAELGTTIGSLST